MFEQENAAPLSGGKAPAPRAPAPKTAAFLGIDSASVAGNTNADWARARDEGGISFGVVRAAYGTTPDRAFKGDWQKMKDAGLLRGAYLFLRLPSGKGKGDVDPVKQARAFIQTVGRLEPGDLPPTLDIEFPGGRDRSRATAQQCLARARAAWNALADHYGVAPVIYTSARVWKEDLRNLPAPDLTESPLWLARYRLKAGLPAQEELKLPPKAPAGA